MHSQITQSSDQSHGMQKRKSSGKQKQLITPSSRDRTSDITVTNIHYSRALFQLSYRGFEADGLLSNLLFFFKLDADCWISSFPFAPKSLLRFVARSPRDSNFFSVLTIRFIWYLLPSLPLLKHRHQMSSCTLKTAFRAAPRLAESQLPNNTRDLKMFRDFGDGYSNTDFNERMFGHEPFTR